MAARGEATMEALLSALIGLIAPVESKTQHCYLGEVEIRDGAGSKRGTALALGSRHFEGSLMMEEQLFLTPDGKVEEKRFEADLKRQTLIRYADDNTVVGKGRLSCEGLAPNLKRCSYRYEVMGRSPTVIEGIDEYPETGEPFAVVTGHTDGPKGKLGFRAKLDRIGEQTFQLLRASILRK
jgi:hypothetical protein